MPTKIRRSRVLISRGRPDLSIAGQRSPAAILGRFFETWRANRERMLELDRWARCELEPDQLPVMPEDATDEFMRLRASAPTAFGGLIVASLVQNAIVDDIRLAESKESAPAWRLWQRNGMDSKQIRIIESSATYGQSFVAVMPAVGRLDGEKTASFLGFSGLRGLGFYTDTNDEFPEFFIEGEPFGTQLEPMSKWRMSVIDDVGRHFFVCDWDGSNITQIAAPQLHGLDFCPVVRYANRLDLDGRVTGEIAPVINNLARIDQDAQDRLVVQRYSAWVVRTIAGMKKPSSKAAQEAARIALGVGDFMVSEDKDTKFGSLPPTPMQGHIAARDSDIRDLAATSQTPSYHLLGISDNMGSDGMAAAEAAHMRKTDLRKLTWGESHETVVRIGGQVIGNEEIANDFESRCHWRQTRTEAFQSLAQAISFLVTAGIPIEMLVGRIPDWSAADTEEMKELVRQAEQKAQLQAEMETARATEAAVTVAKSTKVVPGADNAKPAAR